MAVERIAGAGNVLVPAYLALLSLGYEVRMERDRDGRETWSASGHELHLSASDPLELLGLHCLRTERGADWKAGEVEIRDFLDRFGYEAPA